MIFLGDVNSKKRSDFLHKLIEEHFNDIYKYCWRLVKGQRRLEDFVEECTQETFFQALIQISKLEEHPNIKGWLYVTARNLINNSYRQLYKRKRYEVFFDDDATEFLSTSDDGFAKIIEDRVDVDKLSSEVINKLNENECEFYIDYYKKHMSVLELSLKYNISATATTTRIYRLKKKIKKVARETVKREKEKIFKKNM